MTTDKIRTHVLNESRTYKALKSRQSLSAGKSFNHSATAVECLIGRIYIMSECVQDSNRCSCHIRNVRKIFLSFAFTMQTVDAIHTQCNV